MSYILYLITYILLLTSYILYLTSCIVYLITYILLLISHILYLISYLLYLVSYILYLVSYVLYLISYILYLILTSSSIIIQHIFTLIQCSGCCLFYRHILKIMLQTTDLILRWNWFLTCCLHLKLCCSVFRTLYFTSSHSVLLLVSVINVYLFMFLF